MTDKDINNLKDTFKKKSDEELVDIVFNDYDDYLPEVIQIAREELKSRGIDENSEVVLSNNSIQPTKHKKKLRDISDKASGIFNNGLRVILVITVATILKFIFSDGQDTTENPSGSYYPSQKDRLTKQVLASDNSMSLSVPNYFENVDLQQPGAVLNVGNFAKGVFVRVINDPKIEIQDKVEPMLSSYSKLLMTSHKNMIVNSNLSNLGKFSVNNRNGVRYRLDGYVNEFEFSYLYNIIETNDNFFVIVAFTTKKDFSKYFETFINIIGTFKDKP